MCRLPLLSLTCDSAGPAPASYHFASPCTGMLPVSLSPIGIDQRWKSLQHEPCCCERLACCTVTRLLSAS